MAKKHEQLVADLKKAVVRELVDELGKSEAEANWITRRIRLPSGITIICEGNTIRMIMNMKGAGYEKPPKRDEKEPNFINMQEDAAAFDGWALVLHVHLNKNVQLELDTKGEAVPAWDREKPHYNRFLYRLKKFDIRYGGPDGWFTIEEELSKAVEDFDQYLHTPGITFRNNTAGGTADVGRGFEVRAEAAFAARPDLLRAYSMDLFRQLPVGLFEKTPGGETSIFTRIRSAIDLWGLNTDASGTRLVIYELKTLKRQTSRDKSGKIGIISELMFYANYTYDMYVERKNFSPSPPPIGKKDLRGYKRLAEAAITGIRAFMLTDILHPLITRNVLEAMNCRNIRYDALQYEWKLSENLKDIEITSVKKWF